MKIIKRVDPDAIVIKVSDGVYQNRVQTYLWFEKEYAAALHSALEAVQLGCTNVEVIQRRAVLHTHAELVAALAA